MCYGLFVWPKSWFSWNLLGEPLDLCYYVVWHTEGIVAHKCVSLRLASVRQTHLPPTGTMTPAATTTEVSMCVHCIPSLSGQPYRATPLTPKYELNIARIVDVHRYIYATPLAAHTHIHTPLARNCLGQCFILDLSQNVFHKMWLYFVIELRLHSMNFVQCSYSFSISLGVWVSFGNQ